jgi:hypothetical protein
LVIAAVIDRDMTAIRDLRELLNPLLREVRDAPQDEGIRRELYRTAGLSSKALLTDSLNLASLPDDFFVQDAGQGRIRWHRGVAFPILAGIEKNFAAQHGRGWLLVQPEAMQALLRPGVRGLAAFDYHLLWQACGAFAIIYGNLSAGFLIS